MKVPMNRYVAGIGIVALWVMLFGELSAANVLGGIVVAAAVMLAFARQPSRTRHRLSPWHAFLVLADLSVQLVVSSVRVARAVIRPTPDRLQTAVVAVPMRTDSELVSTVVADLITLTPGTLTLDVRHHPTRLIVHALGPDEPDEVRASVIDLERRVLRAIRPEDEPAVGDRGRTR